MKDATKNVLLVTPLFPSTERPYYCIYLLQLFAALKPYGYEVRVLMPDSNLPDGTVKQEQYQDFPLTKIGHRGGLHRELMGKMSPGFARSAEKIIQATQPDVIDLNLCSTATSRFFISLAKKLGIKSVEHYHGLNVFCNYSAAHPLLEKALAFHKIWVARHADAIIGVSKKIGDIVTQKAKKSPVYTVYNGVDTDIFYPATEKQNAVFTIACVANLIPIKGHKFLLQAARHGIIEHGYPLKLKIIGIGPEEANLKSLADKLGIADSVEFMGAQNYDAVAREVRKVDFFIMPSYFEALGCVYLEAMASNVAVLGVNGCGIDEIITDKVNGYLVDPQNTKEIEERILYAVKNPDQHKKIAQAGYDTVTGKYLWKHAGEALDQVYKELLDRSRENA